MITEQPQFEKVDAGSGTSVPTVVRLRVSGGWIYHLLYRGEGTCAVFVPDMSPPMPQIPLQIDFGVTPGFTTGWSGR